MAHSAQRRHALRLFLVASTLLPVACLEGCDAIVDWFNTLSPSEPAALPYLIVQPATAASTGEPPLQPTAPTDGVIVNIQAGNSPSTPYLAIRVQGGTFATTDTSGLTVACVQLPLVPGEPFGLYQLGVLPTTAAPTGTEALLHVGLAINTQPREDAAAGDASSPSDAALASDAAGGTDGGDAATADAGQDTSPPSSGIVPLPPPSPDPYLDDICPGATIIAARLVPIDSTAPPADAGPDSAAALPTDASADSPDAIEDAPAESRPGSSDTDGDADLVDAEND